MAEDSAEPIAQGRVIHDVVWGVTDRMHPSRGVMRYSSMEDGLSKLIVEVDRDIAFLARCLAPKTLRLNGQRYPPHISVIRHEDVCNHWKWGKYEGKTVGFEYGSYVFNDERFYWLRAKSDSLVEIRLALGLRAHSRFSMPPAGSRWFHITIGNTRDL